MEEEEESDPSSNFRSLAAASSVRGFTGAISGTVFKLYVYDLGASFTLLGFLGALPSLISFFFSRFWSALSDVIGKRKPFILLSYIFSIPFALAYAFWAKTPMDYFYLSLAGSFLGVGGGAFNAALTSISPKVGQVIGLYNFVTGASGTAGGLISGWFVDHFGMSLAFLLGVIGSLIAILAVTLGFKDASASSSSLKRSIRVAFSETVQFKFPRGGLILASILLLTGLRGAFYGLPAMMKMYFLLGKSKTVYSIVLSLAGILNFMVAPYYGKIVDRVGSIRAMMLAMAAYLFYIPILAYTDNVILYSILWAIPIGNLQGIASTTLMALLTGQNERASFMSTLGSISAIASSIGGIGCGYLMDQVGFEIPMLIATLFNGLGLLMLSKIEELNSVEAC